MRDRLERHAGATVDLVKSSGGVFEITVDGKPGFSKKNSGRFPEDRELDLLFPGSA